MKTRSCRIEDYVSHYRIYLLEEGEIIAGLECAAEEGDIVIRMVFVKPARRGQGLALDLMTALRAHFAGRGVRCGSG